MNDIPPEFLKAVPGAAGSFVSMLFLRDSWPRRIALFLAGAVLAYYGTPWAVAFVGLDPGFAGFLLGLFGMAVIARMFESWEELEFTSIVRDWVRKVLGLPAKEEA
jgi:hypothetical protein